MKFLKPILLTVLFVSGMYAANAQNIVPSFLKGEFVDDYGIRYSVSDTLWVQHGGVKQSGNLRVKYHSIAYHIIKWNIKEQYLIAKNGNGHKADENKYTRIDFMTFDGMAPWHWGFCLTSYNALTDTEAEQTAAADRKNPKKGCNGYPFSRMKVLSEQ